MAFTSLLFFHNQSMVDPYIVHVPIVTTDVPFMSPLCPLWVDMQMTRGGTCLGGSFAALLHVSCNFAATAANGNGVPGASVSCNGTDIDNNNVLREGDLLQNRKYTAPQQPGPDTPQCLHNSQNAANENRSPPKPAGLENIAPHHPPIDCCNCSKPAATVQQTTVPAAKQDHTIRARDYKPLEPPELNTPCYTCGKKGSWYVEKLTAERKSRPKDQQDARWICKACYKEAVRAEQMASVPLPGTIDVSRFNRVTADVGKCSVCGMERSGWIDRTTHVLLCEHCYGREVREQAHA